MGVWSGVWGGGGGRRRRGSNRGEMPPLEFMTRCQGTLAVLKRREGSVGRCLRQRPTWRGRWASGASVRGLRSGEGGRDTGPDQRCDVAVARDAAGGDLLDGGVDCVEEGLGFGGAWHGETEGGVEGKGRLCGGVLHCRE